ncbi:hypothetical protein [Bacillus sp. CGMCC 1.16541]|nr:hypothetical protein [Bacillus sp. CGMCC 1.16541]
MENEKASRVIEFIKEANIQVVTLPVANLYLQGRHDQGIVRLGSDKS